MTTCAYCPALVPDEPAPYLTGDGEPVCADCADGDEIADWVAIVRAEATREREAEAAAAAEREAA